MGKDPFLALKSIAYARSQLNSSEKIKPNIIDFARHQICAKKGLLFNDPLWKHYTSEEILIEYFALLFDESEKAREQFLHQLETGETLEESDMKWFEKMKDKYAEEKLNELKEMNKGNDEINETF
jgi:hypothetical protein